MPLDVQIQEYIKNDYGLVYMGTHLNNSGQPWSFGQVCDTQLYAAIVNGSCSGCMDVRNMYVCSLFSSAHYALEMLFSCFSPFQPGLSLPLSCRTTQLSLVQAAGEGS